MPTITPNRSVHLRIRVEKANRSAFFSFLHEAIPYYESPTESDAPGGIRIRLLEDASAPNTFLEIVEYGSQEAWEYDEHRMAHDPRMKQLLERWRGLLAEPPVVEQWIERADDALESLAP